MRGGTPAESALLCLRYRRDAAFWTDGTIAAPSCFVAGAIAAPSCFVAGAIAALFHFVVGTIVARPVSLPVQSPRRFYCRRNCLAALFLFPLPLWRRPVLFPAPLRCRSVARPVQSSRRSFIWQTSRPAAAVFRFVPESVVYGFLSVCERGCAAAYMRCNCAMLLWV